MLFARHGIAVGLSVAMLAAASPTGRVQVRGRRPHDAAAFTQGLLLFRGRLFETTGLYGQSSLREVDPETGEVLRRVAAPEDLFFEGLARVPNVHGGAGEHLIVLTWLERRALVFELESFKPVTTFTYPGEGWGLCFDGERLVMSDGSDRLTFRHPSTFVELGQVKVTLKGRPRAGLNELECVDGQVFANVWPTTGIVRIDPTSGVVTALFDGAGLLSRAEARGTDVLNGIAHLGGDRFLLTGKRWPLSFEVELTAGATAVEP